MKTTTGPVHVETQARSEPTVTGAIRSVTVKGPAGGLEAVLNLGAPDAPFAALVCHPHPVLGGNLHNKVVYHAMKVFNDSAWGLGWPVLRFNFRGAGLSEGVHDGEAEAGDVLAALEWLDREFQRPLFVAGYSFGAAMALRACSGLNQTRAAGSRGAAKVRGLIALGLPTQSFFYVLPRILAIPKLFLSGDHDEFAPAAQIVEVAASAAEPKRLILLHGGDHSFTGQLAAMQQAMAEWLKEQLP